MFRSFLKKILLPRVDNLHERRKFVAEQLAAQKGRILDAGCGSQQFRSLCSHLEYYGQDFGQYSVDEKTKLGDEGSNEAAYQYGELDYIGDIWHIDEESGYFDVILCTEVLEHIPHPQRTIEEFSRLLKPGGTLILTAPSNCLRHMDPFFFTSGYSDRWFDYVLVNSGFKIDRMTAVGDYYSWMFVELYRTMRTSNVLAYMFLLPAFLYYGMKKKTDKSVDSLCMGYHVVARKECA